MLTSEFTIAIGLLLIAALAFLYVGRYRIRYLLCNNQRVQEALDHGEFCDSGYDMVCVHYPKFTPKLFI